jgi:hypothetical protein
MIQVPGSDLIKLFGVNLLNLVCELDFFIIIHHFLSALKRSSLGKHLRKFTPKRLYRVGSRRQSNKPFFVHIDA